MSFQNSMCFGIAYMDWYLPLRVGNLKVSISNVIVFSNLCKMVDGTFLDNSI